MEAFYLEIRQLHVAAALASGAWLTLRGLAFFVGGYWSTGRWAAAAPLQWVAYTLDGVLLTAALMLMNVIEQFPTTHPWVAVKMLGLAAYIALGINAIRPGGLRRRRFGRWLAALAVFGFVYTVGRTHHPLGFLASSDFPQLILRYFG